MLSRRVIAYYGLIRDSESLSATYGFAAEAAAPKEIGLGWGSRGSPIYSAGLCSRAASLTPVAPKSANDCCFLLGSSLHLLGTGSAITLRVSRLQSSFRAYFALILRPASWLALLSRTFTFELALAGSPRTNVEYDYVGKQSIPTTGLSPASPTALWAANQEQSLTPSLYMSRRQEPHLIEFLNVLLNIFNREPRLYFLYLAGEFVWRNRRRATLAISIRVDDRREKLQVGGAPISESLDHLIQFTFIWLDRFGQQDPDLAARWSGRELVAVALTTTEGNHRGNDGLHALGLTEVIEDIFIKRSVCVETEVVSEWKAFNGLQQESQLHEGSTTQFRAGSCYQVGQNTNAKPPTILSAHETCSFSLTIRPCASPVSSFRQ